MKFITTADNFGYDSDTVAATAECLLQGALTSATIMPKMPATEEAVEFALNRNHSIGARTSVRRKLRTSCRPGVAEAPPRRAPASLNSGRGVEPGDGLNITALPVDSTRLRTKVRAPAA